MINSSGSVTINGITDPELAEILEIKAKHGSEFNFNPQQLQPVNQTPHAWYNNAIFAWNGEAGLKVVQQIVDLLLKKEEKVQKAQGQ